uniref:Uncharacterized protein n=1 Tax=Fundulus heteroclitus TaxID=8078 RepID=A0A3Q2NN00_FUNHE
MTLEGAGRDHCRPPAKLRPGLRSARTRSFMSDTDMRSCQPTTDLLPHAGPHKPSKAGRTQLRCASLLRCAHPVDSAGFFSFMTFHWLTPLALRARRKGQLLLDDIWPVAPWERSGVLLPSRLRTLWEEEQRSKGTEASLCSVVWTFCRARLLLSILCLTVTQLAGFSGPVSRHL